MKELSKEDKLKIYEERFAKRIRNGADFYYVAGMCSNVFESAFSMEKYYKAHHGIIDSDLDTSFIDDIDYLVNNDKFIDLKLLNNYVYNYFYNICLCYTHSGDYMKLLKSYILDIHGFSVTVKDGSENIKLTFYGRYYKDKSIIKDFDNVLDKYYCKIEKF